MFQAEKSLDIQLEAKLGFGAQVRITSSLPVPSDHSGRIWLYGQEAMKITRTDAEFGQEEGRVSLALKLVERFCSDSCKIC